MTRIQTRIQTRIHRRTLEAPQELIEAVSRLASRHQRSVAAEIRVAIAAWLHQHGEVVRPPEKKDAATS